MKDWKTTVAGAISALLGVLLIAGLITQDKAITLEQLIEPTLAAIGAWVGFFAKDSDSKE